MESKAGEHSSSAGEPGGWLVLVYRVPSEPTRLRAAVWRRLKGLGAIYLQNSVAALPASLAAERALRRLRSEILDMSGTAALLSCAVLAGEQEVRAAFQAARDDEYEEIVDKCQDFLAEVKKEYTANHFTYAELEENEVDLVKLRNWLERVHQRDVFGAAGRQEAAKRLEECEQALEAYAARVYAEEAESRGASPRHRPARPAVRHRLSACGRPATSSAGSAAPGTAASATRPGQRCG
jgi:ChrB-like protein